MPDISKITLPSGSTYNIKDEGARTLIRNLSGSTAYIGITTTPLYDECTTSTISINNSDVEVSNGNIAIYAKREFIFDGTKWNEFGDLQQLEAQLTKTNVFGTGTTFAGNESSVSFTGGTSDTALGENTTFTLTSGSVTHGTPTTTSVLGANTSFTASSQTVHLEDTTKYLSATASGGGAAWNVKDLRAVVTAYPNTTTDTFVKAVTVTTGKNLVTTQITPTNGTETVSKVTKTTSKLSTTSIPNVTSNADKTIAFSVGGTDGETLIITGTGFGSNELANTYTASLTGLGTAITAATGGVASDGAGVEIVTGVTIDDKSVAKAGSAVTVATGATDELGTGDAIVTGVTVGTSGTAITGLGSPSTINVIGPDSTFTNTQPSITLTANADNDTGRIKYVEKAEPYVDVATITVGSNNRVNAITGMPTSTVGTAITVGTDDLVTAVTSVGTGKAAGQTITVTPVVESVVTNVTLTDNSGNAPTPNP